MNFVILKGNVGQDPKITTFESGDKVAQFSLATRERWKVKGTDEVKEKTTWHNIVVRRSALVAIVEAHVTKGQELLIQGKIDVRKWTDEAGVEHSITEIATTDIEFVGKKTERKEETEAPAPQVDDLPF